MAKFTTNQDFSKQAFHQGKNSEMFLSGCTRISGLGSIEYTTNRKAFYNNRTLVDKEYVDTIFITTGGTISTGTTYAVNLGTGLGVYDSKVGNALYFNTLKGSGLTNVSKIGNDIFINSVTNVNDGTVIGQLPIWDSILSKWKHTDNTFLREISGTTGITNTFFNSANSGIETFSNLSGGTYVDIVSSGLNFFKASYYGSVSKTFLPQLVTNGVVMTMNGTGELYIGSSGAVNIKNQSNNRIITATATGDTLNSETNLTFDGSLLSVSGSIKSTNGLTLSGLTTVTGNTNHDILLINNSTSAVEKITYDDINKPKIYHITSSATTLTDVVPRGHLLKHVLLINNESYPLTVTLGYIDGGVELLDHEPLAVGAWFDIPVSRYLSGLIAKPIWFKTDEHLTSSGVTAIIDTKYFYIP